MVGFTVDLPEICLHLLRLFGLARLLVTSLVSIATAMPRHKAFEVSFGEQLTESSASEVSCRYAEVAGFATIVTGTCLRRSALVDVHGAEVSAWDGHGVCSGESVFEGSAFGSTD